MVVETAEPRSAAFRGFNKLSFAWIFGHIKSGWSYFIMPRARPLRIFSAATHSKTPTRSRLSTLQNEISAWCSSLTIRTLAARLSQNKMVKHKTNTSRWSKAEQNRNLFKAFFVFHFETTRHRAIECFLRACKWAFHFYNNMRRFISQFIHSDADGEKEILENSGFIIVDWFEIVCGLKHEAESFLFRQNLASQVEISMELPRLSAPRNSEKNAKQSKHKFCRNCCD